jgi:hypothetical protein
MTQVVVCGGGGGRGWAGRGEGGEVNHKGEGRGATQKSTDPKAELKIPT